MENEKDLTRSLIEIAERLLFEANNFDYQKWNSAIKRISSYVNQSMQIEENKKSDEFQKLVFLCGKLNLILWSAQGNVKYVEYLENAIFYLSLSIELGYAFGDSFYSRGFAYIEKWYFLRDPKSLDCSIKDFTEAIKLNYNIGKTCYNRGHAYYEKWYFLQDPKSLDSSIEDFTEAIKWDYDTGHAYHKRGIAYYKKGRFQKNIKSFDYSIEDFTKAVKLNYNIGESLRSRGIAYRVKGELFQDPKSLDASIEDFTTDITLNYNIGNAYFNRGDSYLKKGILLQDPKSIDSSIEDFTEAIELDYDIVHAYHNRGCAYFEKGELVNPTYFDTAIDDYSKSIELNSKESVSYLSRGFVYDSLNQLNNCLRDYHMYQYLNSFDSNAFHSESIKIIQTIKEEAYNLFSFLNSFLNKENTINRLLFDFIEVREKLKDYLFMFKYIGFAPSNLSIKNVRFQQALPILIYYLKGCVSSYRLYDERLYDGERELSAQDYYYYVQSSRQFSKDATFIGAKAILEDAINTLENRTNLPCIEKYYLGLLYFIRSVDGNDDEQESRNWKSKALNMFNQTNNLIWSKRMVDILKKENASQRDFDKYVLNHCNEKKEIAIDALINPDISQDVFMEQFADYIHFHEVEDVFYEPRNIFDEDEQWKKSSQSLFANRVVYHDPLWEVFKLSNKSIRILCEKSWRITDEKIVEKIVENLIIAPLAQEERQRIEKDFTRYIEVVDGKEAEDLILHDMKEDLKQEEINLILRYLFEKSVLEKKKYYSLSLYYHCFFNDIKSTKDSRLVLELLIPIVSVTSQTQYIVLLSGLMSAFIHRLLDDKIQNIKNDYVKYSNYEDFSNNLWRGADELWRKEKGRYYYESDDLFDNLMV